jgi:tetratricopeptide (TPR) repeat protein
VRRSSAPLTPLLIAAGLLGCAARPEVLRARDGEKERGREVPALGYAWYARGVSLRAAGRLDEARVAFDAARRADPASGAAWAALAESYCEEEPGHAEELFEQGLRRAAEAAPLHASRARCRLASGDAKGALPDARTALALDPRWPVGTELAADALEHLGEGEAALRLRAGYELFMALRSPGAPERSEAAPRLAESDLGRVDEALARRDLLEARAAALGVVSPGELAVRALLAERRVEAREQALLVAEADPRDPDARAVMTMLGDVRGTAAAEPLDAGRWPSPLARCAVAEHLLRAVGPDASEAWLRACGGAEGERGAWLGSSDKLLAACAERLERGD